MRASRRRLHVLSCLLAAGAATAVFAPVPSAFGDAKRLNGMSCSFDNETAHLSQDRTDALFRNTSGAARTVICPIVEEDVGGGTQMMVVVRADGAVAAGSCRVVQRNGGGGNFSTHLISGETGLFADGTSEINWLTPIAGTGSWAVRCSVPNGSALHWIQSDES